MILPQIRQIPNIVNAAKTVRAYPHNSKHIEGWARFGRLSANIAKIKYPTGRRLRMKQEKKVQFRAGLKSYKAH